MSLKAFHILFIVISILLALVIAVWGLMNGEWLLGLLALAGGALLVVYAGRFMEMARRIGLK